VRCDGSFVGWFDDAILIIAAPSFNSNRLPSHNFLPSCGGASSNISIRRPVSSRPVKRSPAASSSGTMSGFTSYLYLMMLTMVSLIGPTIQPQTARLPA
jgi:hypothetical protein